MSDSLSPEHGLRVRGFSITAWPLFGVEFEVDSFPGSQSLPGGPPITTERVESLMVPEAASGVLA
ncbi:hypothetical protein N7465_006286 [Penicillium sp. CMV-2018d]|nr:hypothetical protein N7465_006286 [Penicillium sp. CMV-2018d]